MEKLGCRIREVNLKSVLDISTLNHDYCVSVVTSVT